MSRGASRGCWSTRRCRSSTGCSTTPSPTSSPATCRRACACGCRCAAPGASSTATSSSSARRIRSDRPLSEIDAVVSPCRVLTPRAVRARPRVGRPCRRIGDRHPAPRDPEAQVRVEKAWLAADPPDARRVDDARAPSGVQQVAEPSPGARRVPRRRTDAWRSTRRPSRSACGRRDRRRVGGRCSPPPRSRTLAAGRSAILVVPDYRDQDQLEAALAARAPAEAVVRYDCAADRARTATARSCAARDGAVHRRRQPLGRLRAGRTTRARRDLGRRRPAARRAAQPRMCTRATPRCSGRSTRAARCCSPGTPAPPTSSASSSSAGCTRCPRPRRVSPRVVLSATQRGRVARRARAVRGVRRRARSAAPTAPCSCRSPRPGYAPVARLRGLPARPHAARTAAGRCTPRGAGRSRCAPGAGARRTAWACPHCASTQLRMASSGSERTADELGRAFPGIRVIVADGEHPVAERRRAPALVIATRGAEPVAAGGYRAVSCSTATGCCRPTTCASASRACAGGRTPPRWPRPARPCTSSASTGAVARALATWTQPAYARAELADRAPLRMPPDRRGSRPSRAAAAAVETASPRCARRCPPRRRRGARAGRSSRRLPPSARALVRFDYAHGPPGRRDACAPRSSPTRCTRGRTAKTRARPVPARIHSEFGSTCPTSTCEETVMRLVFAGTPAAAVPVAARARGIRCTTSPRSSRDRMPRSGASACSRRRRSPRPPTNSGIRVDQDRPPRRRRPRRRSRRSSPISA